MFHQKLKRSRPVPRLYYSSASEEAYLTVTVNIRPHLYNVSQSYRPIHKTVRDQIDNAWLTDDRNQLLVLAHVVQRNMHKVR